MKTLVAYSSRTGKSKIVAEKIAPKLSGDACEIEDLVNRMGLFGFIRAGYQGVKKKKTPIGDFKRNCEEYELIILISPIWANHITCPMRTFVCTHGDKFKKFACFITHLDETNGYEEAALEIEELLGKKSLAVGNACVGKDGTLVDPKIEEFVSKIVNQ